ncbi:MAG: TetR/AcrR family transcriptional regulator [Hyphomonadaceae bacterium]|nr:TetR/AcrR family transcriptional regulator [Hyphomonadaceae bacterium]
MDKISQDLPDIVERGADAEKRAGILDAAEAVFLEQGFSGASMAAIAARGGCSKGTLYNYFESKDELFLACVRRACEEFQSGMAALTSRSGDVRQVLSELGRHYLAFVTSEDIVRKFRMIVAEAERSPQLARSFYLNGQARGTGRLVGYLQRAMDEGLLRQADPERAAHHFFGLCNNRYTAARLCNVRPAPNQAEIELDVSEAVRVFMAAYGPE